MKMRGGVLTWTPAVKWTVISLVVLAVIAVFVIITLALMGKLGSNESVSDNIVENGVTYQTPSYSNPYQEIGTLQQMNVPGSAAPMLLQLSGRRVRQSRFQYYTNITQNGVSIRTAVHYGGRDCQNENGCDELYDNETVTVPATGGLSFKVTLYPRTLSRG